MKKAPSLKKDSFEPLTNHFGPQSSEFWVKKR